MAARSGRAAARAGPRRNAGRAGRRRRRPGPVRRGRRAPRPGACSGGHAAGLHPATSRKRDPPRPHAREQDRLVGRDARGDRRIHHIRRTRRGGACHHRQERLHRRRLQRHRRRHASLSELRRRRQQRHDRRPVRRPERSQRRQTVDGDRHRERRRHHGSDGGARPTYGSTSHELWSIDSLRDSATPPCSWATGRPATTPTQPSPPAPGTTPSSASATSTATAAARSPSACPERPSRARRPLGPWR
ncbi:hypothetical protein SAMN05660976_00206 [Nonomuraea pusilla]|uniref:Uncharacterized protein n=1 Tax=Nonomuraea pusilla TaxID=46177 RepID=A0A1H7FW01_9ACTN|nr:hypothetical protein SAMN05660976_00206 [Nonomuraea pusilla]